MKAAVQTKCRTNDCSRATLLHLAVDDERYVDLPSLVVVESLLEAGADVNSMDANGNTPLHVAVFNMKMRYESQRDGWLKMINLLLEHDAHVDNAIRQRASDMLPSSVDAFNHVSLQCLAARTTRTHLPYHGILPTLLADFVDKH